MSKKLYFLEKSNRGIYNKAEPNKITYTVTDANGEVIVKRTDANIIEAQKELQRMVTKKQQHNPFGSMNKTPDMILFGGKKNGNNGQIKRD